MIFQYMEVVTEVVLFLAMIDTHKILDHTTENFNKQAYRCSHFFYILHFYSVNTNCPTMSMIKVGIFLIEVIHTTFQSACLLQAA